MSVPCSTCDGTGRSKGREMLCPDCRGSGSGTWEEWRDRAVEAEAKADKLDTELAAARLTLDMVPAEIELRVKKRLAESQRTLLGVLEALDLDEAYANGHDVVKAAKALATDIEEMGSALLAAESAIKQHSHILELGNAVVAAAKKLSWYQRGDGRWALSATHNETDGLFKALVALDLASDANVRGDGSRPGKTSEGASVSPSFPKEWPSWEALVDDMVNAIGRPKALELVREALDAAETSR